MATLGFSTNWPKQMGGGETNFIDKIWQGCYTNPFTGEDFRNYRALAKDKFGSEFALKNFPYTVKNSPKLHTIRADEKNLWQLGRKIHIVVFNRTKNRFQFAPVLEVKSVQIIKITYDEDICEKCCVEPAIFINGKFQSIDEMEKLAVNDGFESLQQFCGWFNKDFTGKIIHWTNLKY